MYKPTYRITPYLMRLIEEAGSLRFWIEQMPLKVTWLPLLQHEARVRSTHSSTAIEGNPLTLAQVNAVAKGETIGGPDKDKLEVENYIKVLHWVEKNYAEEINEAAIFNLHKILTNGLLPEERSGRYKDKQNYVIDERKVRIFTPPSPAETPGAIRELLDWLDSPGSRELPPVLVAAIFHHRFVSIHPFIDGNGRLARALAAWILYQHGYDTYHIFSLDDYFAGDRQRYYQKLQQARELDEELTHWIEYVAEGVVKTLKDVKVRIEDLQVSTRHNITLTPGQEELIRILRLKESVTSADLRETFKVSRARVHQIVNPLVKSGLVKTTGQGRSTRYLLVL